MGIIGAAFGLGFVFGPPLGGWLYSAGSHSTYGGMMYVGLFTALLCVLNFILAFVLLLESNTQLGAFGVNLLIPLKEWLKRGTLK